MAAWDASMECARAAGWGEDKDPVLSSGRRTRARSCGLGPKWATDGDGCDTGMQVFACRLKDLSVVANIMLALKIHRAIKHKSANMRAPTPEHMCMRIRTYVPKIDEYKCTIWL